MPSMFRTELRATLVAGCLVLGACAQHPHGAPTRVIIPRGASFADAADSLSRAKLVGWPKMFRVYARLTGGDRKIKPGTYLLRHGTPWSDIVSALHGGHGLVNTITIPEGYTISQITPLLAKTLNVPVDSVDAAVRDTSLLARLDVPTPTLEGYLFPDTYAFPVGTTARQAVHEMVYDFERRWKPEWDAKATALQINKNDLVTMASIVEREARLPEERPVIAAVYYNRLRKGMLLQADPTVQYALGHHVGRVLYKDLTVDSPYNTYLYKGLPPGPVASPGVASLEAAANPASVPYLYFVASRDGHHEFRMTLGEHTDAIREVRAAKLTSDTGVRRLAMASAAPTVKPATKAPTTVESAKKPATRNTIAAKKTTGKKSTKRAARTTKKTSTTSTRGTRTSGR
ncbi:MAG TPA: endolytic transglycosylase MltG [Gemmatimonadaceae bacterium]|nr:endolytic transglycosylase MltG [Gemmatimonadaceae bacterium]